MKVEDYLKHVNMHVTDEIRKFVEDYVFSNWEYMFFSKDKCYCSRCKTELKPVKFVKLTHNDGTICPVCGTKLIAKNTKFGRKNCLNEACFYYFEKSITDPKVVVCKGYYVEKDYFIDYKNPEYRYELCAVYIFTEKEAVMLKKYYWDNSWEKRSSIFDFNIGWLAKKMCYCSFESIGTAIKDTAFKYIPYEMFQGYYSMVKIFDEYIKHPWIEQICKVGFDNIIKEKLNGNSLHGCLNYKGKNIFQILRLNRKDLKELRESKVKITPVLLRIYQVQAKDNLNLTVKDVEKIEFYYSYYTSKFENICKYMTMIKAANFMDKQYEKYKKVLYSKGQTLTTYSDYISDCKKLKMDLNSAHVLFPKNIYTAHQNTIKQVKFEEDKELNEKIEKRLPILEKYYFENNNLFIRPAKSTLDLINEGKALNHCVGGYGRRYADGATNIFFIRKVSEPDKSFCTVEIRDNKIIQSHIKNNHYPDEETQQFIKLFQQVKLTNRKQKIRISA